MGAGRNWTAVEEEYLDNNWGSKSIKAIAKKLKRSIESIKAKAYKNGLGRNTYLADGITVHQLAKAIGVSPSYTVKDIWIDRLKLPHTRKIMCEKRKMTFVKIHEFWKWAEKHKRDLNFSRFEENMLGIEPAWVKEKRDIDIMNMTYRKVNVKWTPMEDLTIKNMLKKFEYTYSDISKAINRTEGAIKARIRELGLKERPIKTDDHIKWTDEETKTLIEMYKNGYGNNSIGDAVERTARAIEGKIERLKRKGLL
jgi:hypothetical protein